MKRLGFGMMRMPLLDPTDEKKVDKEQVKKMVDLFLSEGYTYFDTAWMYHDFTSENVVKEVLVDRHPRESFQLATKLHSDFFNSLEDRDKVLQEQLKKTGAHYFDNYLLHGIDSGSIAKYEEFDCFNWLKEKKKEGVVKHIGFSYHDDPALLDEILTKHPEMEFVQLQLNYLDWDSEWIHARANYEVAKKHGVPVIVMEPVKGGTLARLPEKASAIFQELDPEASAASWAVRFVASLDGVMLVLSGMSDMEQLEDNLGTFNDFQLLTEEERKACFEAADVINGQTAIPCTACHYCTPGCPEHIPIPEYFSLYNEDMREDLEEKGWTVNYSNYGRLAKDASPANACIECGQCESVCPQHIPIIRELKSVSEHYDHGS